MFTKKQKRINWILVAVLLVLSIFFLFPVIWMLANSFKPDAAITADMNSIAAFIPPALNGNFLDNYISIITDTNFLRYMLNTLLYAAILIVLSIVVNGLAGYALAKIKFTTELQDDALIAKYSDARIGRNLRARINDLIDDAKIGQIADEDFQQMSISKGMQIIAANAEIERYKHPMATPGQIALLQKMEQRGQIDLHKIDLTRLRFRTADQWIKQNINNPARNTHNPEAPATTKQRGLLTLLVREKLIKNIPYPEWRDMTVDQASKRISSVPPRLLQQAIERQNAPQRNVSPRQRTSMER